MEFEGNVYVYKELKKKNLLVYVKIWSRFKICLFILFVM